jgi:plastocyanin
VAQRRRLVLVSSEQEIESMKKNRNLVLVGAVVLLVAAACGGSSGTQQGSGGQAAGAQAPAQAPTQPAAQAEGKTIEIVETDFALNPSTVTIDAPGVYTFVAVNKGQAQHALEIEGPGVDQKTSTIGPGGSARLTVEITQPGTYTIYCPVEGHRNLGMQGTLHVQGSH